MIFAIWGLTVLGTGKERAGTSSTGAVWALPTDGPSSPNIPHKTAAARDFHITAARISFAGALIAFPQFNFLCFRRTHCVLLCNPGARLLFLQGATNHPSISIPNGSIQP
jgi:hypothetical protein